MFRLSGYNRLSSEEDFKFVFAKPSKISARFLLVLYRKNTISVPRLGIIVKKQYLKRAVDRNTFRRLVRESFRMHKDLLKGLDIVVLLRSECTPLCKKTLRHDIDGIWPKLISKQV